MLLMTAAGRFLIVKHNLSITASRESNTSFWKPRFRISFHIRSLMRSKKKTRITSLCMPLPIRMGITKGQWIYLLALAVEFGAVALVGKLGDMNVASMFVAAKMFDRRAEG